MFWLDSIKRDCKWKPFYKVVYLSSDFKQFHPWMADTTRRQVEELPCSQILPAFSILQFLSLTRKPGFQSSWNRKLVNFDFLIFFEQKFFFEIFFLVKKYKISDFFNTCCSNMCVCTHTHTTHKGHLKTWGGDTID